MVKKIIAIILVLIIALPVGYIGFGLPKKVVGESEIYSASEIKSAMKVAKKEVKGFDGILKLLKIKYNEKRSLEYISTYQRSIVDEETKKEIKLDKENSIVVFIDFATKMKTTSLNPLDIYENYSFILYRENKNSDWVVIDSGY